MPIFDIDEIKELLNAFDSSKATELEVRGMDGERLIFKQTTAAPVIVANEQPIIAQQPLLLQLLFHRQFLTMHRLLAQRKKLFRKALLFHLLW